MLRLVGCLLMLNAAAAATETVAPTCRDLKCASRESLISQISTLKKEAHVRDQILADSTCTACYSSPCQNGGQCTADGDTGYRCDCPEDTVGFNCEKKIVCEEQSCGKNANCFIQNHQTNCACDYGYSGDATKGCDLKTRRKCFNGDPHYQTFDGATFDYQATCPYIFSLPCNAELENGYEYYSVKAKNDIQSTSQQTVSYVTSTQVVFYNKTIFVDRSLNVFVDDIEVHTPYYYPSQSNAQFSINFINPYVVVKNDQFVQVEFRYSELCLTIPDVPEFRGTTTLCGLAGNFDDNCNNDLVLPDGSSLPYANCRPSQAQTDQFADAWRTVEYTQSNPAPACIDGTAMTNNSKTCPDLEKAGTDCLDIFNAQTGQGPFAACQVLGPDAIERAYDSCIYDVCLDSNLRCDSFLDFVHSCQMAVGGVDVSQWRAKTTCPLDCPMHTSYTECVSGCPATCAAHDAPDQCNYPCAEGCECDYGYVLDTTSLQTVTCIPVEECGCTDDDGNAHPANERWLSNDCSQASYCQNGTFFTFPYACQANARCGITDGDMVCICDAGYEFNHTTGTCDDIDECLDLNSCSVDLGFGQCVNTPGSYYCECAEFYTGHDCETFAPRRHCADLFKYHGVVADGAYDVTVPGNISFGEISVYCDMTRGGGGWTLIGNAITNETADKTLEEYAVGFGSAEDADLWFGLDLISLYTNYQTMSLRLNLYRCEHNGVDAKWTDCTYTQFAVSGRTDEYRVTIPEACRGTEVDYYDGWARWDLKKAGPKFIAFDNDSSNLHCSEAFRNTGWWYDTSNRCGSANLNGVRHTCDDVPENEQSYLFWNGDPLNKADMYIRPSAFPDYD